MDIYGSILSIFNALNETATKFDQSNPSSNNFTHGEKVLLNNGPTFNDSSLHKGFENGASADDFKSLAYLMDEEREKFKNWTKIFESITPDIVSTITSDITFAPLSLKVGGKFKI